jgi:hypothetical protein
MRESEVAMSEELLEVKDKAKRWYLNVFPFFPEKLWCSTLSW